MNAVTEWMKRGMVVTGLVLALGAASVHAQGETPASPPPIPLNPDGTVYVEPAPLAVEQAADEDDPPIPPDAAGEDYYVYVSSPSGGTVAGIAYADEDVLRQDTETGQWMKAFDGTNAGLPGTADVDALDYRMVDLYSQFYLSFDAPTAVPGLGTVDDSDVVLYSCFLGGCSWSMVFDGSAHGLTTDGEDIDGLDVQSNAILYFSTLGGYSVPKYPDGTLQGGDEDIITYAASYGKYLLRMDGSVMGLAGGNDTRAFDFDRHYSPDRDWIFLSFEDPFTYSNGSLSAGGAPNDVFVDERASGGSAGAPRLGTIWDASAEGFPKVDALELVEK